MNCRTAKKLISLYLDSEIEGPQQDLLLAHLGSCQSCKQEMKDLSAVMEKIPVPQIIEPSPYFFVKVRQKINARESAPLLLQFLLSPRSAVLVASAVALSVFGGILLGETTLASQAAIETASEAAISDLNSGAMKDMPDESFTEQYDNITGGRSS